MIFYDFILGIDSSIQWCGLVTQLYNETGAIGKATDLPVVSAETPSPGPYAQGLGRAMLKSKQPVPKYVISGLRREINHTSMLYYSKMI